MESRSHPGEVRDNFTDLESEEKTQDDCKLSINIDLIVYYTSQLFFRADSGLHKQFRRVDDAPRQDQTGATPNGDLDCLGTRRMELQPSRTPPPNCEGSSTSRVVAVCWGKVDLEHDRDLLVYVKNMFLNVLLAYVLETEKCTLLRDRVQSSWFLW